MNQPLTNKDIDGKYQKKIYIQDYGKKPVIDGVKIIEIKNYVGEDGDFAEIMRLNERGESEEFPGFVLRQISRSKMIPGSVKAWHIHFAQDDIWHVLPDNKLLVALWDVRKDSPTKHLTMRFATGGGKAHLIYIPRGVAHGAVNYSEEESTILYFVNAQFNIENPDEVRLPWDSLGEDFWEPIKG